MENPDLITLLTFLDQVKRNAPANFSKLSDERRKGYGMLNRYIKFCLSHDLIRVVSKKRTRGRYLSKEYSLSERGSTYLTYSNILSDEGFLR